MKSINLEISEDDENCGDFQVPCFFFNTRESLFIVTSDRHSEFPCWAILCCKNHVDVQTSSTA